MTGKIFPESDSIYQDQARILLDYYSQAAERIVREEEAIEARIAAEEQIVKALNADLAKARLWKWVLCILIIPFIYWYIKEQGILRNIRAHQANIEALTKEHASIFRGYKVTKLGVAYVPVAEQIRYEDRCFIVDHTGTLPLTEMKLQLPRDNERLIGTIKHLEELSARAPVVEGARNVERVDTRQYSSSIEELTQHEYTGDLDRSLREVKQCVEDLQTTSVSLPLIANGSEELSRLREYGTTQPPPGAPVIGVFDASRYREDIAKFQELNKLRDSLTRQTQQFEDVLKGLMVSMASSVQAVADLRSASTQKMVTGSNHLLLQILRSPYNHYSPTLEAAEIERIRNERFDYSESVQDYRPFQLRDSSRMRHALTENTWRAADGSSHDQPFAVHQIHEEIIAPVVQNLMNETRIERLKIYNHIKDQKIEYLNKWHQDTEGFYKSNRAESSDLINRMRESLRAFMAAYSTMASLKKTEDSMARSKDTAATIVGGNDTRDILAYYEKQSQDFQNVQIAFEDYMELLKEDIDQRAEKFQHIEYYDGSLRDGNVHDLAVATSEAHDLDERRRPLIQVNPLFAKNSELPPVPNVEPLTAEHAELDLPAYAHRSLAELDNGARK